MITVLTVSKAGLNKIVECALSGEFELVEAVEFFHKLHPTWEVQHVGEEYAVLEDHIGNHWVAEIVMYDDYVEFGDF